MRKKRSILLFHFLQKGHFTCESMEIGIIEGDIALLLSIIKHILTCGKKSTNFCSVKSEWFGTFWHSMKHLVMSRSYSSSNSNFEVEVGVRVGRVGI